MPGRGGVSSMHVEGNAGIRTEERAFLVESWLCCRDLGPNLQFSDYLCRLILERPTIACEKRARTGDTCFDIDFIWMPTRGGPERTGSIVIWMSFRFYSGMSPTRCYWGPRQNAHTAQPPVHHPLGRTPRSQRRVMICRRTAKEPFP